MLSIKRQFGDIGEEETERFLVKEGYEILQRNYRVKNLGEIDIIGEKKGKLFFFEVKTRSVKHETVYPVGFSIGGKKRRNLKRVCQIYLDEGRYKPEKEWQVDAIFVRVNRVSGEYSIEHIENILWERYY